MEALTIYNMFIFLWHFVVTDWKPMRKLIYTETMRKLYLSTKFPHQKIIWNYGILPNDSHNTLDISILKPFPAGQFKINNKKDHPNRFILFLTYSG